MARAESKYSEDWIRENLDEGFEYISGFKNAHSYITIKGVKCGHIFEKSMVTITKKRTNPIICPECRRIAGEKRKPKETREQKKKRNDEIAELRKQGYTLKQLAEKYGMNDNTIGLICKEYGLNKPEYKVKGTISKEKREELRRKYSHSEDWVREKIDKGFEYVGGFKNVDSYITLKCKECGYIFERSFITIRKGRRTECPECKRVAKIQREIEQKEEAERRQKEREEQRRLKQIEIEKKRQQQIQMKKCECCGNAFYTVKKQKVYCSDECAKRANYRKKEHNRRIKIKERMVDNDITIEKLFDRDNGKCAICGGECDWNDYTRKNNFFVTGNFYPSIDHIIPLSKGGLHSWENVQLAHFICNTKKRDNIPLVV